MRCFLIEWTGIERNKHWPGPSGSIMPELLYRRTDTNERKWTTHHAPGLEFGPGCMMLRDDGHLIFIPKEGWYIDLDANGRTREGIPPMITVMHTTPVVWTLENGEFEADQCRLELYLRGIQ